jgi:hypothetical protein
MSFSARCLPAILLTLLSFCVPLCAQPETKQNTKTVGGSVSGRVTIKEKPAVGVVISLRKTEVMPFESFPRATTDPNGVYRITSVPAGAYEAVPAAPGYVLADLKDARGKQVLVGEDENVDNVNFALVRGGVITGRITDADGRPVIQQQVNIYAANAFDQTTGPPRPTFAVSNAQTDDRGIYRVYGLAAGRYKVAAGRSEDGFTMAFGPTRSTYKQVFHPDATEPAKATVIEVSEGSEAANVDIVLGRAVQTFTVTGRLVDGERGLPVPNLRFGIQRVVGSRVEFVNTMTNSNSQGDFIIEALIPGKYSVFVWPGPGVEMRAETLSFDVIDQDITGLTVKVTRGASVTGLVVLETEDKSVLAKLSGLQLRGMVMSQNPGTSGMGSSATSPIGPDGGFRLSGLPGGTINFMLGGQNTPFPPKGMTITRIERDGIPATGRGIEIKEGEQVTGVRVVLVYGNASVRGFVKLENGSLPEGARIFVRITKPGENTSTFRSPQVDLRGFFLMEGIPGGTYEISANVVGSMNAPIRPRSAKREVTLQDGVVTDLTITLDMGEAPRP